MERNLRSEGAAARAIGLTSLASLHLPPVELAVPRPLICAVGLISNDGDGMTRQLAH